MTKRAFDTKSYTVTTAAVATLADFGFDDDHVAKATGAIISTTANTLMITWSTVDPTASLGHPATANEWAEVCGDDTPRIRLIAVGGNAPTSITLER